MKEVKVIGYVGNKYRFDYDALVYEARRSGQEVYDFMNTSDDTLVQDILKCDKLYVIGEKYEMSELAQDVIAYANLMGKPILSLNGITESEIRCFTINFCMNMAEGLTAVNEGIRIYDTIYGDNNDLGEND